MIDLLLTQALDPVAEPLLLRKIAALAEAQQAAAGRGNPDLVEEAELAVRADPAGSFRFDPQGSATLTAARNTWHAGHFEAVSIGTLRQRAATSATGGRVRLWVIAGGSPLTDIGSLQATAGKEMLFQVASQFNCLESPGAYVTPVTSYFRDSTQGPRASISAFPGTLLRHYSAPGPDGERFVQESDKRQIDLLADVCDPAVARVVNGYLSSRGVADPHALVAALKERFDSIRVGVHNNVQVVLGYDWAGAVEDSEHRRIAQVFTSTVAGGGYGGLVPGAFEAACRQLLRAAYLGTLLAAATLGRSRVVLTLIGGGVFSNPIPLIWDAIQWAIVEVEPLLSRNLDVVINGRNLGLYLDRKVILDAVRTRGGVILAFAASGQAEIYR